MSTQYDVSAIATTPGGTIYAGTLYSGLYRSTNGGATFQVYPYSALSVQGLLTDSDSETIAYAAGYGGGVYKTTDGGDFWNGMTAGLTNLDVRALAMRPDSHNTLFAATAGGVFKSVDGASSWAPLNVGVSNIQAVAVDPVSPDTVYAGGNTGVYKSVNGGTTWVPANSGIGTFLVKGLVVDPSNPLNILVCDSNAGIYRSATGGSSWSAALNGFPPFLTFGSCRIVADPSHMNTFYVSTLQHGVFKTTNGGDLWLEVSDTQEFPRRLAAQITSQ